MSSVYNWNTLAPDGRRRVTKSVMTMVMRTVQNALDHAIDTKRTLTEDDKVILARGREIMLNCLFTYPLDRSCLTCSKFHDGNFCMEWGQAVPSANVEDGCEKHSDEDVPF